MGIVTFRGRHTSLAQLVSAADKAMYEAKSSNGHVSIRMLQLS
ncbi:MAG: hypothetical protein VXY99_03680 [Pseudomonadota bacterium]|nr:hypothetical protein [Pseudomonadota bacterium]